VQTTVDREPTRPAVTERNEPGTVESWTTPFNRDGQPEKTFLAVRGPDGSRTLAVIPDPATAALAVREDIGGATVTVHANGTATLH
jgi:acetyl-CoA C-acetyltransferase